MKWDLEIYNADFLTPWKISGAEINSKQILLVKFSNVNSGPRLDQSSINALCQIFVDKIIDILHSEFANRERRMRDGSQATRCSYSAEAGFYG